MIAGRKKNVCVIYNRLIRDNINNFAAFEIQKKMSQTIFQLTCNEVNVQLVGDFFKKTIDLSEKQSKLNLIHFKL